jgi:hypothetical protein
MNRNGAATASILDELEQTQAALRERGPLRPGGDNGPMLDGYMNRIEEGVGYSGFWAEAVHNNGVDMPSRTTLAFEREWSEWGKSSRQFDQLVRGTLAVPPDQLDEFLGELSAGD